MPARFLAGTVGYRHHPRLWPDRRFEFGTKNDAYGERARMLVFGPTIEFAVPRGFLEHHGRRSYREQP